jgi:hypothetical protein
MARAAVVSKARGPPRHRPAARFTAVDAARDRGARALPRIEPIASEHQAARRRAREA